MTANRKKRDFYFFGFGNMAQAIYQRMDKEAFGDIYILEKSNEIKEELHKTRGVSNKNENFKLSLNTIIVEDQEYFYVSNFDIFLLAVKPLDIEALCKTQLTKEFFDMDEQPFIISIAAGVTTRSIDEYLGDYGAGKLIRAMPNLCAKQGLAMTGIYGEPYYFESGASSEGKLISEIFKSIGQVLWVDKESDLDSITAISGSGPAYIYYIMNAMIETAEELGIEKKYCTKSRGSNYCRCW
jgi:pyrroline-5-carboxylate reductase